MPCGSKTGKMRVFVKNMSATILPDINHSSTLLFINFFRVVAILKRISCRSGTFPMSIPAMRCPSLASSVIHFQCLFTDFIFKLARTKINRKQKFSAGFYQPHFLARTHTHTRTHTRFSRDLLEASKSRSGSMSKSTRPEQPATSNQPHTFTLNGYPPRSYTISQICLRSRSMLSSICR